MLSLLLAACWLSPNFTSESRAHFLLHPASCREMSIHKLYQRIMRGKKIVLHVIPAAVCKLMLRSGAHKKDETSAKKYIESNVV